MSTIGTTERTKITRLEGFHQRFADAFNSGKIEPLLDLYEEGATLVPQPGQTVSGHAAIAEALRQFQAVGKMTAETRWCIQAEDVALASAATTGTVTVTLSNLP